MGAERLYPPNQVIGGTVYRVVRHLATGGMGTVYDVEDTTVGKRYVLKTLHPDLFGREDLARVRPAVVIWRVERREHRSELTRLPQVGGVVGVHLVGADAQRHARFAKREVRHHAAAQTQVAHRVVRDRAPRAREQRDVGVVDPDRVDHHHPLVEQAEVVHVTDERAAVLLRTEHALQPRLEDVDVERQVVTARKLGEIIDGADVFLGVSAGGVLKADMVKRMADRPLIMALANPTPEIMPEEAVMVRPDAMICTGRSDFPNQVNNVLCFPYIFRGALDCGATRITEEMKLACVREIAALAKAEISDQVAGAYAGQELLFGPEHIIPKPFDPRLILRIAPEVARSAMATGVARKPIVDFKGYEEQLSRFVFRSGLIMKPIIEKARSTPKRVLFCDGEDERVLRATQVVLEDGIGVPILVGRPAQVARRIERFGLRTLRRRDLCEIDVTSLRLRNDLLCDDQHVAGDQREAGRSKGFNQNRRQMVARLDQRDAGYSDKTDALRHATIYPTGGKPVMRMPAPGTL